jgi:hypothetical protein
MEAWLRGPIAGVPPMLQPVAHALVQAKEEVESVAPTIPADKLWTSQGGASAGFHIIHLAGALDRLFTYARGEALSEAQRASLKAEAEAHPDLDAPALVSLVGAAVDRALDQLRATDPATLLDDRRVGRSAASTTLGLLFHGAEHTTRHAGQLITTAKLMGA